MITKLATAITSFSLDVFEDDLDRDSDGALEQIKDVEDKLKELASADVIKGSLVKDIIRALYSLVDYNIEWRHPQKVSVAIKEKWLYKKVKIKKRSVWCFIKVEEKTENKLLEWKLF